MARRTLPASHPGEILRGEYLVPHGISVNDLARVLHVPQTRIRRLVAGKTPVTVDTALRLAKFFSTTPQYWLEMQNLFDLTVMAGAMPDALRAIKAYEAAR